jgi:hypothetical protein
MSLKKNTLEKKVPYFYSYSHIIGCLFAIFGLILHLTISPRFLLWYEVAFIFYMAGALSFREKDKVALKLPVSKTITKEINLPMVMNKIIWENKQFLPDDAIDLLISISKNIEKILPKLEVNSYMLVEAQTIKKIVYEYLPTTLDCYKNIPSEYAVNNYIKSESADKMLIEQLTLLDSHLKEIFKNLLDEDVKALIINGRFLKEKFAQSSDYFNIK